MDESTKIWLSDGALKPMKIYFSMLVLTILILLLFLASTCHKEQDEQTTPPNYEFSRKSAVKPSAKKAVPSEQHQALLEPEIVSVSGGETDAVFSPEEIDAQLEQLPWY